MSNIEQPSLSLIDQDDLEQKSIAIEDHNSQNDVELIQSSPLPPDGGCSAWLVILGTWFVSRCTFSVIYTNLS
jgi:hypothetical protein